jgi:hypothetical protein
MGTRLTLMTLVLAFVGCGPDRGAEPPPQDRATAGAEARAEPPREIPPELYDAFVMDGAMAVTYRYSDDSYSPAEPRVYTKDRIAAYIEQAQRREPDAYGVTDEYLFQAFDEFSERIEGKDVAVMGSTRPWYEAIVLAYGGRPTTIEYNTLVSEDPRLTVLTVEEYEANPTQFDVVLSISSYEHDGLGRYGDPVNPDGDLQAMQKTLAMLREGGLLFVAVPVGRDTVVWNAHRVYGKARLPRFFEGWEVVESYGFEPSHLDRKADIHYYQPVFVLAPE